MAKSRTWAGWFYEIAQQIYKDLSEAPDIYAGLNNKEAVAKDAEQTIVVAHYHLEESRVRMPNAFIEAVMDKVMPLQVLIKEEDVKEFLKRYNKARESAGMEPMPTINQKWSIKINIGEFLNNFFKEYKEASNGKALNQEALNNLAKVAELVFRNMTPEMQKQLQAATDRMAIEGAKEDSQDSVGNDEIESINQSKLGTLKNTVKVIGGTLGVFVGAGSAVALSIPTAIVQLPNYAIYTILRTGFAMKRGVEDMGKFIYNAVTGYKKNVELDDLDKLIENNIELGPERNLLKKNMNDARKKIIGLATKKRADISLEELKAISADMQKFYAARDDLVNKLDDQLGQVKEANERLKVALSQMARDMREEYSRAQTDRVLVMGRKAVGSVLTSPLNAAVKLTTFSAGKVQEVLQAGGGLSSAGVSVKNDDNIAASVVRGNSKSKEREV